MPFSNTSQVKAALPLTQAMAARTATPAALAQLLQDVRAQSLALFDSYVAAGSLTVPYNEIFNPPLWELGHVGWFQEYWIARNQQRHRGIACDPVANNARTASILPQANDWYDSSLVSHASRWHLAYLQAVDCKQYLASTLQETLNHLQVLADNDCTDDAALYFYRLALLHEAMHAEAAIYMAQALGMPIPNASIFASSAAKFGTPNAQITVPAQRIVLGSSNADGFSFDNELQAASTEVTAFSIDAHAVSWEQYLPFVEATNRALPRYVVRTATGYEAPIFGRLQPLPLHAAAVHLTYADAADWCAWAKRRLPTEAEWECAAMTEPGFNWGEVWEWTATKFAPYAGFVAHPYLDYSAPWFGTRMVLRGACAATLPIMRHPKYRNYFTPERNDIYAGFRSCAL